MLAEIAASAGPTAERAQALLEVLRRLVPFDAAWMALADPQRRSYQRWPASTSTRVVRYLSGPVMARDIEVTGTDRARPPLSPSDLPYPAGELPTWADCLIPAGIHEALAVGLFAPPGRHVGFLALLSGSRQPPSSVARRRLGRLAPSWRTASTRCARWSPRRRLVGDATAGAVLRADGGSEPLPGLRGDALLSPGSPALAARPGSGRRRAGVRVVPVAEGRAPCPGRARRLTVLRAPRMGHQE